MFIGGTRTNGYHDYIPLFKSAQSSTECLLYVHLMVFPVNPSIPRHHQRYLRLLRVRLGVTNYFYTRRGFSHGGCVNLSVSPDSLIEDRPLLLPMNTTPPFVPSDQPCPQLMILPPTPQSPPRWYASSATLPSPMSPLRYEIPRRKP